MKDESGQFVKSHLDEAGFKEIAEATGGMYPPLGAQGQGLDTIYQQALAPLAKHDLASRRQKSLHGTLPMAARGLTRIAACEPAHWHATTQHTQTRSVGGGDGAASAHGATRSGDARGHVVPAVQSRRGFDYDRGEGLPKRRTSPQLNGSMWRPQNSTRRNLISNSTLARRPTRQASSRKPLRRFKNRSAANRPPTPTG